MVTQDVPRLSARDLAVSFGERVVLDGVDFTLASGEIAVVEGPSGGGKSTFLRALATLQEIGRGELFFEGKPVAAMASSAYRVRVAYVPQAAVMFAGTVGENVRAGPRLRGIELSRERVAELLVGASMDPQCSESPARALSGGEKQRVAIARALANEPKVILFDEPTSALDPESASAILGLVRLCADQGCAVAVVTHAREHADALGGTHYVCEGGRLRRSVT